MKTILQDFCAGILLLPVISFAQDTALTYSHVIVADSFTRDAIYDKALIWCGKSFGNSNYAIKVKEKESGIISGKGFITNFYKVPKRNGDSTDALIFNDYYFDWLIEIKNGKLRLSMSNIEIDGSDIKYPVTSSTQTPFKIILQRKEVTEFWWKLSKANLIRRFDKLSESLTNSILKSNDF